MRDPEYPPVDSGILGDKPPADNLSIVVGVGASLFDDRFGLADRKPKELETMPFLANDNSIPSCRTATSRSSSRPATTTPFSSRCDS